MKTFLNRIDAGKQLATVLEQYRGLEAVVVGVIRGGLIVAHEVAKHLDLPLDFVVVRKIGCPDNRELGAGVVTTDGKVIFNERILSRKELQPTDFEGIIAEELQELKRRHEKFRQNTPSQRLVGKTVVLVDDGIAVGVTLMGAIKSIQAQNPQKIVLAVPISSPNGRDYLANEVAEIMSFLPFQSFGDVGDFYEDFGDTPDEEVENILKNV